jgi:hypothetical protein
MKFTTKDKKRNDITYNFPNKKEEEEYIHICTEIWGCVPVDTVWAKETNKYKNYKKTNL